MSHHHSSDHPISSHCIGRIFRMYIYFYSLHGVFIPRHTRNLRVVISNRLRCSIEDTIFATIRSIKAQYTHTCLGTLSSIDSVCAKFIAQYDFKVVQGRAHTYSNPTFNYITTTLHHQSRPLLYVLMSYMYRYFSADGVFTFTYTGYAIVVIFLQLLRHHLREHANSNKQK